MPLHLSWWWSMWSAMLIGKLDRMALIRSIFRYTVLFSINKKNVKALPFWPNKNVKKAQFSKHSIGPETPLELCENCLVTLSHQKSQISSARLSLAYHLDVVHDWWLYHLLNLTSPDIIPNAAPSSARCNHKSIIRQNISVPRSQLSLSTDDAL